jgi:periplasmic mercuric ion binding protein
MKTINILFLLFICLAFEGQAQESKVQWITIKSANLKCWECKERLDKYLIIENKSNMEGGIVQWKFFLLQGEIKLQYYPDRVTPDMIKTALNNAGFDADNELATEEAYKMLPKACKRANEGGGPQPRKPCHLEPLH